MLTANDQPVWSFEILRLVCNNLAESFQSYTQTRSLTFISGQNTVSGRVFPLTAASRAPQMASNWILPQHPAECCVFPFFSWARKKKLPKVTERMAFFSSIKENASIYSDSRWEIKASLSIRAGSTKESLLDTNLAPYHPFSDIFPGDSSVRPSIHPYYLWLFRLLITCRGRPCLPPSVGLEWNTAVVQ